MEAGAELQPIADRQPDEQRQARNHLEIDDRPQSDHTDPAHVAHLGNANGDCREDDQWHDRPDEHDKAIADRPYAPKSAPSVFESRHASTARLTQSMMTAK